MASDLNQVVLVGRLTRDPEIRQTPSGTSVGKFSLANNRTYNYNNERREEVLFMDCTVFGRLTEIVQRFCSKGKQVAVTGRLKQNTWQSQDGKKQSKIELVVENLQLLGGPGGDMGSRSGDFGSQDSYGGTGYGGGDFGGYSGGSSPSTGGSPADSGFGAPPPADPPGGGSGGFGGGGPAGGGSFPDDDIPF